MEIFPDSFKASKGHFSSSFCIEKGDPIFLPRMFVYRLCSGVDPMIWYIHSYILLGSFCPLLVTSLGWLSKESKRVWDAWKVMIVNSATRHFWNHVLRCLPSSLVSCQEKRAWSIVAYLLLSENFHGWMQKALNWQVKVWSASGFVTAFMGGELYYFIKCDRILIPSSKTQPFLVNSTVEISHSASYPSTSSCCEDNSGNAEKE